MDDDELAKAVISTLVFFCYFILGTTQLGYSFNYIGNSDVCQNVTIWLFVMSIVTICYSTSIMFQNLMLIRTGACCDCCCKFFKSIIHYVTFFTKIILIITGSILFFNKCNKHDVGDYETMILFSLIFEYVFLFFLFIALVVRMCK